MTAGPVSDRPGSTARRVARNAGWLTVGEVAARLLGLATVLFLARVLGPEGYGTLSVASALFSFLLVVARWGTAATAVRSVARSAESMPDVLATITGLRIAGVGVVSVAVLLVCVPLSAALSIPTALVLAFLPALAAKALAPQWAFRGLERMHVPALVGLARGGGVLLLLVLCVGDSPNGIFRVPLIEGLVSALVAGSLFYALIREHGALALRFDWGAWRPFLREGTLITGAGALRNVYSEGGAILLGVLSGPVSAGVYVVAHKVALTLALVSGIIQEAALPGTLRLTADSPRAAVEHQALLLRYLHMLLALPVCLGIVLADDAVIWLYGGAFADAATVLQMALASLPFVMISGSLRPLLIGAAQSRGLVGGAAVAAAIHVSLAVVLIPQMGAAGAALACTLGEAFGSLRLAFTTRSFLGVLPIGAWLVMPWLAAAAAVAAFYSTATVGFFVAVSAAVGTYALALLALGCVEREDFERLRRVVAN